MTNMHSSIGASSAQIANAMRMVPAQLTDIAVGLQAGQAPLTVLLQQGGQLRDMFGSAGAAMRGVATSLLNLVTPYTVAGAAALGLGLAYKTGVEESSAYAKALAMTGNAAGASVDQMSDLARQIGAISGSQAAAAEALAALAGTGQVSIDNMKQFGTVAVELQRVLGRSVADTAADFAELGKSPLSALEKMNEKYHFLTVSTYAQVKALQDQGKASEAADAAQAAYANAMDHQKQKVLDSLTDWERGWIRIKTAISGATDAVIGFAGGRDKTNFDKINVLLDERKSLEENRRRAEARGLIANVAQYDAELAANLRAINVVREKARATRDSAAAEGAANQVAEARIKWMKDGEQYLGRSTQLENAITKARNEGAAAHLAQSEIDKRVAAIRKSYSDIYNASIESTIAAMQRRDEVAGVLDQRELQRIQAQRTLGGMSEVEAINATAAADLAAFDRKKALINAEIAQTARKANSVTALANLNGQIAVLDEQRRSRAIQQETDLLILADKRAQASEALYTKGQVDATAELNNLIAQTVAQFEANQAIGLTTKQVAELAAARMYSAAALKDETAAALANTNGGQAMAKIYRDQAQQMRDLADARVRGAAKQEIFDKPLQDLNAMVDIMSALDSAAQSAAQGMAQSFGTVGQAIGGMTTALTGYERTQAAIAAQLAGSLKSAAGDPVKIQRANQMAAEASAQAQIKSYGDMASAAKGFFGESSKGYAVLQGVEKAYRAAEMVMALESMAKKILFKETEVAANTALNATKLTGEATTSAASTGLAATEASAWGVTAVVKSLASLPFPWNLAAGAATLAAVVAVGAKMVGSIGGGSSVSLSQQRQQDQGKGSVFGDTDAKSESLKKALDAVEKNTYQGLAIDNSMLATLRSIDSNISSFAGQLVRSTDITSPDVGALNTNNGFASTVGTLGLAAGGAALGGMAGAGLTAFTTLGAVGGPIGMVIGAVAGAILSKIPAVANLMTSIFGGKQSVEDSGFGMNAASLASILSGGAKAFQYADIKTSGGWFGSDKRSEKTTALDAAANQQFTSIITSMADSVKASGALLGLAGDDFTNKLNGFVVDIGHVSLKDLKGDELQKALESVFSKLGDDMAQYAVGGLQTLQQVGEGYLETLVRVASEYQTVDVVFQSFGKTFGQLGLESIAARDRLVQLAGGLDKFAGAGEYFLTNFFSEQEQAAALKARIDPTLAQYGLSSSGEDAARMFRNFVVGLDTTTEAGARAYTVLMGIAPALKQVTDAQQAALDQRKDLQDQLDELTMNSNQLLAKQRDALDESNRALFDQVQAVKAQAAAVQTMKDAAGTLLGGVNDAYSALQKVVTREKSAIQSAVDTHTAAFGKLQSLSQALHSTLDSFKSPEQLAYQRAMAQAEIRADLAITRAGGRLSDAQTESLKKALGVAAQDAAGQFSTYADYMRDLLRTQSDVAQLAGLTDDSLSVEQRSLDALKDQLTRLDDIVSNGQAQLDALNGQSIATLTLAQAMTAFQGSISTAQANPVVSGKSTIAGFYQDLLGRAPDQAGLQYWLDQVANGSSLDNIRVALTQSDEYKRLHPFAVGTNFVPETMPALVHQGERIIPAADNRVLMSVLARAANGGGDNAALVAEIRALRETVARQQAALDKIEQSTRRNADILDNATAGGNAPMLVEVAK